MYYGTMTIKLNLQTYRCCRYTGFVGSRPDATEEDATNYCRAERHSAEGAPPPLPPSPPQFPAPHPQDKGALSEERSETTVGGKHRLARTVKIKATVWHGAESGFCRLAALSLLGERLPRQSATQSVPPLEVCGMCNSWGLARLHCAVLHQLWFSHFTPDAREQSHCFRKNQF